MKCQEVSAEKIYDILHSFTADKDYWQSYTDDKGVTHYAPVFAREVHKQARCCLGVPSKFAIKQKPDLEYNIERDKIYKQLKFVRDAIKERALKDSEIKHALKIIQQSVSVIKYVRPDGNVSFFSSYTKGTARYGKKQASEAQDYIKNHVDAGWESYFLTLTCDIKKYENRLDAWTNYKKLEVMPVLENLRKHENCEYIGFMESTEKGYPHIHIVMFFPKGTHKEFDKQKNGQVHYFGKLFNHVKRNRFSPQTKLVTLKGDNVKFYLTKYVTKETEQEIFYIANKKESLTKNERKLALGLICTKATKRRTKIKCKDRSIACCISSGAVCSKSNEEFYKVLETVALQKTRCEIKEESVARLRAVLIKLCTNSPMTCSKVIESAPYVQFKRLYNKEIKEVDVKNEQEAGLFTKISNNIGCSGCFLSHFMCFLCGDTNNLINKRFYFSTKDDIKTSHFEYINEKDDIEWYNAVSDIVDFYMRGMCKTDRGFKSLAINQNARINEIEPEEHNLKDDKIVRVGKTTKVIALKPREMLINKDWYIIISIKNKFTNIVYEETYMLKKPGLNADQREIKHYEFEKTRIFASFGLDIYNKNLQFDEIEGKEGLAIFDYQNGIGMSIKGFADVER